MTDLFGNTPKEIIRTLGFYQPFGTLMLHGKIETRWVRINRRPGFKLGKYLLYTTKEPCKAHMMFDWCGPELMGHVYRTAERDPTEHLNGYAIAIADLVEVRTLTIYDDESLTFVRFIGTKLFPGFADDPNPITKQQYALVFENVQRIEPFEWRHGKQGPGIVPEEELTNIKILTAA